MHRKAVLMDVTGAYVAGSFNDVNDSGIVRLSAARLARWNAGHWSALSSNGSGRQRADTDLAASQAQDEWGCGCQLSEPVERRSSHRRQCAPVDRPVLSTVVRACPKPCRIAKEQASACSCFLLRLRWLRRRARPVCRAPSDNEDPAHAVYCEVLNLLSQVGPGTGIPPWL
jgi:hypothetical protein